jgi:hypothetical protein
VELPQTELVVEALTEADGVELGLTVLVEKIEGLCVAHCDGEVLAQLLAVPQAVADGELEIEGEPLGESVTASAAEIKIKKREGREGMLRAICTRKSRVPVGRSVREGARYCLSANRHKKDYAGLHFIFALLRPHGGAAFLAARSWRADAWTK